MNRLDDLYAKLPHAGGMCLLEEVLAWDEQSILCATSSHRSLTNPLRCHAGLSAVHGVEYAAQAAAVHGVLSSALDGGPVLLLGAVRDLELTVPRLDGLTAPLMIAARLEARLGANASYRFALTADGLPCASGRITLMRGNLEDNASG
ncbi:3-hydroxyacyl-ACP dehydratase [Thiocystis violascens]|uniref:Putative 3-hydroxylacyl-(Acyl carrier protein) dehydratase n=1 Tax=Thiocystis violascens (strain ATCC 17096 / DSM 198 / 6111) TaxID=765911 RepID=I3YB37_THIV6|nr:3-hydroxyacyl-ACP dehydratase [Thiocystis violascens]AFL74205.1 putative 3-hydroxylacyl-(acyl carrier protein) dehydratase [Thiocystis violascens DSM 198]